MSLTHTGYDVGGTQEMIYNLVKFILNNVWHKYPIKRSDMIKEAVDGNAKMFEHVLAAAQTELKETYGLEVHLVAESKSVKKFIVTSEHPGGAAEEYTEEQSVALGITFCICSHIFMKGGSVNKEALFNFLKKLDIETEISSSIEGNMEKFVNENLVKQLYLKKEKVVVEGSDDTIVFSWGARATLEFSKMQVLEEVANILKKQPAAFVEQFSDANGVLVDDDTSVDERSDQDVDMLEV